MSNNLGYWNPQFYANEALAILQKRLGMLSTVYMGYDAERRSFGKGDTINIRRPSNFVVNDAPSAVQDLKPESLQMTLDKWREVKFALTDKDLAFTTEKMISDHIAPAAIALADDIDQKLIALWDSIPHAVGDSSTTAYTNQTSGTTDFRPSSLTRARKKLFNLKAPIADQANMYAMLGGDTEEALLNNSIFGIANGAGTDAVELQRSGFIARKYGFKLFANQNLIASQPAVGSNTNALVFNGAAAAGATTISVDGLSAATATVSKGTIFSVAHAAPIGTREYVVTATATGVGSAIASLSIYPPLAAAAADNDVTVTVQTNTSAAANIVGAYHRDAFAIAMAPLSEIGNQLGAKMFAVQDPITGAALRARLYYVGGSSQVEVALDVLYGVKIINPEFATKILVV